MSWSLRKIIEIVLLVVITVALMPVVWDSIYTDSLQCLAYNTSITQTDCTTGVTGVITKNPFCHECVWGTAKTLLELVPFIFVGVMILGGALVIYIKG